MSAVLAAPPELNPQQQQAVSHGAGALLILAGPGSGKTLTVAERVARLVRDGADPRRILLLSFSRRAAQELERRAGRAVHRMLGLGASRPAPRLPWAGTFHGIGARLLRDEAAALGLAADFTILDRGDAEELMGLQRQALELDARRRRFALPATCLAIYSRVVNSRRPLADVLRDDYPWCADDGDDLRRLFGAYCAAKHDRHLLDFDDLLLHWWQMMQEPSVAARVAARFDHVLVDEYQDTNRLQAAIVHALSPDGRGVTVVGDDAQSIYGFRAAEPRNILDFPAQYPAPARVVTLERNYRSTQPILDCANALMRDAVETHPKTLWTERAAGPRPRLLTLGDETEQAAHVADRVLQRREQGLALRRQAVLFRAAHHSAALELELARRNIPFVKFGGLRFLESAHVKDLLSLLRWVHNPRHDIAGFRVARLVQGIGPAAARRLLDAMAASPDPGAELLRFKPPAAARTAWDAFAATWRALREAPPWPQELTLARDWLLPQLERLYDDAALRDADLLQLQRLARGWGDRAAFLAELTLDPPEAVGDAIEPHRDEDYLILSTIHSAKGQEWSAVTVLNVVDGCIPSDLATGDARQIEEERRLLFVAMTRARDELELVAPQRFYVTGQVGRGDRHVHAVPSRFVAGAVDALLDHGGPPRAGAAAPSPMRPEASGVAGVVDVMARARAMWD